MKKFVIIYTIISIFLFAGVTFIAAYNNYYARLIDVYQEISNDAADSQDFDQFVAFQTKAYILKSDQVSGDYRFYIYESIGESSGLDLYQLSIYVLPLIDVTHATEISDTSDQTNIEFNDIYGDKIYALNEDESFSGQAISFGIESMGFYYAAIQIDTAQVIDIVVSDYDGNEIYTVTYNYLHDIDINDSNVSLGMTTDELSDLVDFNGYVRPKIVSTVGLYLVVDILLGAGLYFYRKKSKKL